MGCDKLLLAHVHHRSWACESTEAPLYILLPDRCGRCKTRVAPMPLLPSRWPIVAPHQQAGDAAMVLSIDALSGVEDRALLAGHALILLGRDADVAQVRCLARSRACWCGARSGGAADCVRAHCPGIAARARGMITPGGLVCMSIIGHPAPPLPAAGMVPAQQPPTCGARAAPRPEALGTRARARAAAGAGRGARHMQGARGGA